MMNPKSFMPISIDVSGKRILLIGGGKVALHKIESLLKYTNNIFVLARKVHPNIKENEIQFVEKEYESVDIIGSLLVYACTNDRDLNRKIREDCQKSGILVNVVDKPADCDFVSPAIHKDNNMSIAVSSNGQDVFKSIRIRNKIKELFIEGID